MRNIITSVLLAALAASQALVAQTNRTEGTRPLSPNQALGSFRLKPGLMIELAAAEPLVEDPVAIDWGADGTLWVCEMNDYPSGMDNQWQPGGRVKRLHDDNGDGLHDRATTFLEGLPFPTGVTAWGKGVFICAAPDLLFAQDTDGDGKADKVEKLFTGFFTDNFQARINSLSLGLDNWIYAGNGLLGGTIQPLPNSLWPEIGPPLDIRNRDLRIHPFRGTLETASGLTQYGRVRDDWDNWFGSDNSRMLLHYPYPEHYLRRNPFVPGPAPIRELTARPEGNRLFPTSPLQERFNDPWHANRVTSACGLAIYRDTLLGAEYYGNAFGCEPVHNLVHREVIEPGLPFSSQRAQDELESEFLSSTDNWFRPAQVRCGPDGALYVVDMYRFLIEHPRWIPAERLAKIDIRAGSGLGRIYRVRPEAGRLRPIRNLTKLAASEVASALDSPNGVERDRVHIELLLRQDKQAAPRLKELAGSSASPQVRVQALAALEGLSTLEPEMVLAALRDRKANVRIHALRLAEPRLSAEEAAPRTLAGVLALTNDPAPMVIRQLAFTLGESRSREAGLALAGLAAKWRTHGDIRTAILTSARHHAGAILGWIADAGGPLAEWNDWVGPLAATAANGSDLSATIESIRTMLPREGQELEEARLAALAILLDSAQKRGAKLEVLLDRATNERVERATARAMTLASNPAAPASTRKAAIALASQVTSASAIKELCGLAADPEESIRRSALAALKSSREMHVASELLRRWADYPMTFRPEIIAALLGRDEWIVPLLEAVRQGTVRAGEFSRADRQRLNEHPQEAIRKAAAQWLPLESITGRAEVLARYAGLQLGPGRPEKGRELFEKNCATCHALDGVGQNVGPDLAPLRGREPEYWAKNIFDPNAVIEPRYINYNVELKDGRSLSGLIKNESATSLTIVSANGMAEEVLRTAVEEIRASNLSLMPEGLEEAVTPEHMGDLLAFIRGAPAAHPAATPTEVLRNAQAVARLILDSKQSDEVRQTAVLSNPQFATALIEEMTRNLVTGAPEEYARIPWLWRVAIACGRRNDGSQIKAMLGVSLPKNGEPLRDWQAVVIGGGIINGLSQRGLWPRARIEEMLAGDAALKDRWSRTLELSAAMAEDEKVPAGTRYDALRMIALQGWEKSGQQLLKYLAKGTHPELQMGAVSGLADIPVPEAGQALKEALKYLEGQNRTFAVEALKTRKFGAD